MKSYQFNSAGGLVASANTDGGGGGAGSGKSVIWAGNFWTYTTACPTSWTPMVEPLFGNGGTNQSACLNSSYKAGAAGYITAMGATINGSTNNANLNFAMFINGTITTLTMAGQSGSAAFTLGATAAANAIPFNAGDVLMMQFKGDSSSINQSWTAKYELVLTA